MSLESKLVDIFALTELNTAPALNTAATASVAGLMSTADKTKLNGVATGVNIRGSVHKYI